MHSYELLGFITEFKGQRLHCNVYPYPEEIVFELHIQSFFSFNVELSGH